MRSLAVVFTSRYLTNLRSVLGDAKVPICCQGYLFAFPDWVDAPLFLNVCVFCRSDAFTEYLYLPSYRVVRYLTVEMLGRMEGVVRAKTQKTNNKTHHTCNHTNLMDSLPTSALVQSPQSCHPRVLKVQGHHIPHFIFEYKSRSFPQLPAERVAFFSSSPRKRFFLYFPSFQYLSSPRKYKRQHSLPPLCVSSSNPRVRQGQDDFPLPPQNPLSFTLLLPNPPPPHFLPPPIPRQIQGC